MQETTKYGVAVFDFDGTIIHGDSFISFARFAVGNLHFAIAALMSSPWLVAWKLKIIPGGKAKEHLFRNLYRGMNIVEFKKHCRDFTPWIQSHMIAGTAEKLNRHTSLGHRIYIISASPAEWIRPWAAAAGIPENNIAGTEIELTPDGNITGSNLAARTMNYGPTEILLATLKCSLSPTIRTEYKAPFITDIVFNIPSGTKYCIGVPST